MHQIFFSQYVDSVLLVAFAYAVVTIGLQVTLASGQFSVAHAALMGLGGYAGGVISIKWNTPFIVSLIGGAVVGGIIGAVLARILVRTSGVLLGTVTIAIGQAASIIMRNTNSIAGVATNGSQGLSVPSRTTLPWAFGCAVAALAGALLLRRSRPGFAMLALGKDETVARSLGVSLLSTRIWGFAAGGALAGLGGVLLAHNNGVIEPADLSFAHEPLFFIFLVIGGSTTPWGAALGAVGMWWLQEFLRFPWSSDNTFLFLGQQDRYWILGVILVVVVLYRQRGIIVRRPLRYRGVLTSEPSPSLPVVVPS
ncbi:MAG: branched-chain amino acid transporter permease [Pseudonocardiales bacterium]|nr:branched-chain amino acid transporter permease [Pseudonocardiales bacterium]